MKTVLVITLSNIGDIVLTTPVISRLRSEYPSAHLTVMVGPKGISLLRKSETIDDLVIFDKRASFGEQFRLIKRLRQRKFDLVVDLRNTLIPWLIRARVRSPLRIGQGSVSMRARHLERLGFLLPQKHERNHFHFFSQADQVNGLGKVKQRMPKAQSDDWVVLAPGAGSGLKRWTTTGFCKVIQHLHQLGRSVILVGEEGERQLGLEIENLVGGRSKRDTPLGRTQGVPFGPASLVNLIGRLTLREVAGLIAQATLVVANDSAVMHLAHELGCRTVSIFGPTNHNKYWCPSERNRLVRLNLDCTPCEKAECQIATRVCLDDLPANQVIAACEELLHVPTH